MPQTFNASTIDPAVTTPAGLGTITKDALLALQSNFSGASLPTTNLVGGQLALDTANKVYWRRDSLNAKWMLDRSANDVLVEAKTATFTAGLADFQKTFNCTGSWTPNFAAAATLTDGWYCHVINSGSGVITLDPNAAETIDGAATIQLAPGETCCIYCDGTQFKTIGRSAPLLQNQTATAFTTAGTSTAYTLTPAPALSALVAGKTRLNITPHVTAGVNPTINVSGLGAVNIKLFDKAGGKFPASAVTMVAGIPLDMQYDGTDMVIMNPRPAVKVLGFTRDLSLATSNLAITGIGFTPRNYSIRASVGGVGFCFSDCDGAASSCMYQVTAATVASNTNNLGYIGPDGSNYQAITHVSFDADGLTLNFAKVGTPTGTWTINITARM